MAVGDKATEFAGLPVVDYHPAVGLVLSTMPRREFRSPDGEATWAIALEDDRVTVFDGGRTQSKASPRPEYARARYGKLILQKAQEGYTEVKGGSLWSALADAVREGPDDVASRNAFADYLAEQGVTLPAAYRVETEKWDEVVVPRLRSFLADPAAGLVEALVIGWWGNEMDSGPELVIDELIAARDRLPNLRALFLGDIPFAECEISWIYQADLTELLAAFPNLEHFRSRGGRDLALQPFRHEHLKSLALEASNLPREVVRVVGECDLPALEHLEVWLGTARYGADTSLGDLEGIFLARHLPSLRYLGLRNSEIADDIAAALATAPVMERLRVLDLSLGTLSDRGAEALLAARDVCRLQKLDIHHHSVSEEMVEWLRRLGIEVDAGDPQDRGEGYRYVAHAE
jgi:uncharacterized protein (TIGR02996 family)